MSNGGELEHLEVGEATWSGGRVVSVYDSHRQALLQSDVAIGGTILGPLDSVYAFNPSGGDVAVTLPEAAGPLVFTYTAVDYAALTLTLVANTAGVLLVAGSVVRPDPALIDRLADVREGTQVEPITCRVPYGMRPWLPVGTRTEGQGEEVLYGATTGAGYVLHDVLGAVPLLPEGGSWVGDMPVGTVMAWPDETLPARWVRCDGALLTFSNYPELGALLGATYGGDGVTTFGVPNLTARFPRGASAGVPGAVGGVDAHAHGSGGVSTDNAGSHDHGSDNYRTGTASAHDHGSAGLSTPGAGSHGHDTGGSHSHGSGGLGTGSSGTVQAVGGSGQGANSQNHTHGVSGSTASGGSHGHGSASGHSHGVAGSTASAGSHDHNVTGRSTSAGSHGHNVTGTGPSVAHLPAYLELVWIIKATPGGDPLADGTYVEVRDEGVPDVPQATALDFRGAGVDVVQSGPVAVVTVGAQSGVTDHGALTGLADDDHAQYLNTARGDVRYALVAHLHTGTYEPAGAVAAHEALPDPHPVYLTSSEGNAAYEGAGAVAAHAAVPDPHSGYATDSEVATAIVNHDTAEPHPGVLTELGDVETAGAAQGDRLTYRGGVWHPEPAAAGGSGSVADFVRLTKGSAQNVASGAGGVKVNLSGTDDPAGYWDNANERLLLPEGVWQIHAAYGWAAGASRSGRIRGQIYVAGVLRRERMTPVDTVAQSTEVQELVIVPEGNVSVVEFYASQNSGAGLTLDASSGGQTVCDAILIGPLPPSLRLPDIVAEVAPAEGTAPVSVDGHVTNVGGVVTGYSWNMGDGSALLTGADVTHVYTVPGVYTVTCTATGPMGTDVSTASVSVS